MTDAVAGARVGSLALPDLRERGAYFFKPDATAHIMAALQDVRAQARPRR